MEHAVGVAVQHELPVEHGQRERRVRGHLLRQLQRVPLLLHETMELSASAADDVSESSHAAADAAPP